MVLAEAPEENRTQIALDYASQYLDIGPETSKVSFGGGGESCILVRPVGFGFCVFDCGGVLALLECDIEP